MSLPELVLAVNAWCDAHRIEPVSGQAAEALTERNVRYYRSLGLLDAPAGGAQGYSEKHLLQLIGIRVLQAKGLPLRRIQELLYGRNLEQLCELRDRALEELPPPPGETWGAFVPQECWQVIGVTERFAILSRSGPTPSPEQIEAIRRILENDAAPPLSRSRGEPKPRRK